MTGSEDKCRRGHHCVFFTQYHIIFCPKFRFSVLKGDAAEALKEILGEICTEYDYVIKALEVMQDHVHLFVSCPQTAAPSDIARTLRSRSAIMMFRQFPGLKRFYSCCGAFWSRGYFIASVGSVSEATVRKYIEEQRVGGGGTPKMNTARSKTDIDEKRKQILAKA